MALREQKERCFSKSKTLERECQQKCVEFVGEELQRAYTLIRSFNADTVSPLWSVFCLSCSFSHSVTQTRTQTLSINASAKCMLYGLCAYIIL